MRITGIQEMIRSGKYRVSEHAVKRMIEKRIERNEVIEAIMSGEIIEEYPTDKYSPSCLIYGNSNAGRDLHVLVSLPPNVIIITTYPPEPEGWINYRTRRCA